MNKLVEKIKLQVSNIKSKLNNIKSSKKGIDLPRIKLKLNNLKPKNKNNPKPVHNKRDKNTSKNVKISKIVKEKIQELKDKEENDINVAQNFSNNIVFRFIRFIFYCIWIVILVIYYSISAVLRTIYSILNILLLVMILCLIIGVALYARIYPVYQEATQQAYEKLSTIKKSDFEMEEDTKVYDKDKHIIGRINAGNYKYININKVSKYVQEGYIAKEDKRFLTHVGIDAQSIARAAMSLVAHNGEITQGGSTITQQVVKNCLLTREQTYTRKIIEILVAPRIEQKYSKADIMEFYVNTNFYGNNCYGIETASRFYFGKSCKNLSLGEAAMLCGVSNSPSLYNPVANFKLATKQKNKVLKDMYKEGYISKKQYKKAKAKKIKLSLISQNYKKENYMTSYAIHCATLKLMEKDGFEFKYVFKSSQDEKDYKNDYQNQYTKKSALIRSGGYKIYTSFSQDIQNKLQATIDADLARYTETQENGKYALQGAGVCIDNNTGFIVAMVGGRGSDDEFNRAFLSKRQPGSSIKPLLVYAPAINNGVLIPSTVYDDKPVTSKDGTYSPKNAGGGYSGRMTVREAIARSVNTIAYQIYNDTGKSQSIEYLGKMKFSSLAYADNYVESLCLGGFTNGIRIVDECKGYATIAMDGNYTNVNCIKKFVSNKDGTLYNYKSKSNNLTTEVFTEDTSFMMKDIMQGAIEEGYGTAHNIKNDRMIIGGKTGTTNSSKDLWFSGFTSRYTATFWIGYDTPRAMPGISSSFLAKMFSDFMTKLPVNMKRTDFKKPSTIKLRHASSSKYIGKNIDYEYISGSRWYYIRQPGTEWYSELNNDMIENRDAVLLDQERIETAKKLLEDFCNFYIESVDDALELDARYQSVISAIDSINDTYESSKFMKKCVKHYELLNGSVIKKWNKYKVEYFNAKEEEEDAQAKINAEDSLIQAQANIKQNRLDKVKWFLNELNKRQYYTDTTKLLVKDAKKALENINPYDEYDEYAKKIKIAISRVKSLPTEIPQVEIVPEDSEGIEEDLYDQNQDIEDGYMWYTGDSNNDNETGDPEEEGYGDEDNEGDEDEDEDDEDWDDEDDED